MKHIDSSIVFPLTLTWEDGSTQSLSSLADIECNLEDYDSSRELNCSIVDAEGFDVHLKVSMTWIENLKRLEKSAHL